MSLRFDAEPARAAWLAADIQIRGGTRRLLVGPSGFESYARVLALPDPAFPGQAESEIADDVIDASPSDVELTYRVAEAMGASDTEDLFLLLWDGWPYEPALPTDAWVTVSDIRRYALARGTLRDWSEWLRSNPGFEFPPAFAWPRDNSWCLTYDVDAHFVGVGGSTAAIDRLLDHPQLTAVRTSVEERLTLYR